MPRQCAHARCRNIQRKGNGLTFHLFPTSEGHEERRRKWCIQMKRVEGWKPKPWDVVCSQHFLPVDFDLTGQTKRLRHDAVPSKFDLPEHLQKHEKKRQTQTSKRALEERQDDHQAHMHESNTKSLDSGHVHSSIPDFHSYAAPNEAVGKVKLRRTEDRVADLELQLKNTKAREKRCKSTLSSIEDELKEHNLMTAELEEKLQAYRGRTYSSYWLHYVDIYATGI
uniref:THAP domain-containing protein 6-like n=1 Tax=Myxine glutinosa TaxID=7769 RepID=UPI00358EA584